MLPETKAIIIPISPMSRWKTWEVMQQSPGMTDEKVAGPGPQIPPISQCLVGMH